MRYCWGCKTGASVSILELRLVEHSAGVAPPSRTAKKRCAEQGSGGKVATDGVCSTDWKPRDTHLDVVSDPAIS